MQYKDSYLFLYAQNSYQNVKTTLSSLAYWIYHACYNLLFLMLSIIEKILSWMIVIFVDLDRLYEHNW